MKTNTLHQAQVVALFGGSVFAWWTIVHDFQNFFAAGYKLSQFSDCVVPNPLATPCFYGGIVFVIALIWAITIWMSEKPEWKVVQQARLWWLLLAGTLFGWGNFGYVVYKFAQNDFQPTVGCAAAVVQTPFQTPCFYGASIYLIAFIIATLIKRRPAPQA